MVQLSTWTLVSNQAQFLAARDIKHTYGTMTKYWELKEQNF